MIPIHLLTARHTATNSAECLVFYYGFYFRRHTRPHSTENQSPQIVAVGPGRIFCMRYCLRFSGVRRADIHAIIMLGKWIFNKE